MSAHAASDSELSSAPREWGTPSLGECLFRDLDARMRSVAASCATKAAKLASSWPYAAKRSCLDRVVWGWATAVQVACA